MLSDCDTVKRLDWQERFLYTMNSDSKRRFEGKRNNGVYQGPVAHLFTE